MVFSVQRKETEHKQNVRRKNNNANNNATHHKLLVQFVLVVLGPIDIQLSSYPRFVDLALLGSRTDDDDHGSL